jgi:uncharacterized LabA/DUF88 family protein
MAKVNVFIDGTWLFNACKHDCSLANATEYANNNFPFDFNKLNSLLVEHIKSEVGGVESHEIGDRYIATSIFELPDNFDDWARIHPTQCSESDIQRVRAGVHARRMFVERAKSGGYREDAIFTPRIKPYIVKQLSQDKYQEKQVDATVVALLVKYAITKPEDYHVTITGDSDMLPAIKIAYPEYTVNVAVATTHPDGLLESHRQSAYSLINFDFCIKPLILEENAEKLIEGENIYRCAECSKVFRRFNPIHRRASTRVICSPCHKKKQPYAQ